MLCCLAIHFILSPNVYTFFDATVQNFLFKAFETTAHTPFSRSRLSPHASFCGVRPSCACLRLLALDKI